MNHRIFIILLFFLYITLMTAIMIWQGIGIAPDRYAFILLLGSLFVKRTRSFILDWIPFLFILISYDFLRGFADDVSQRVHFVELIEADKFIFGNLPTVELQKIFYSPFQLMWYDYTATILYFLHFALPLGFGFILWLINKSHFRQFVTAILLLSYAGWITYILYPASPPWLAQEQGYISGVTKIMNHTLAAFPDRLNLPTIYHQFNPNPVAAIPSMHAAYPFLVFLFAVVIFKKKALFFLAYVLAVWISIVYLGEHYVIDVIAGAIYALVFFAMARWLLHHQGFQLWIRSVAKQAQFNVQSHAWQRKKTE